MLIKKYDYTPILRNTVEGKRLYSLPDGSAVPSVTTILDRTKPKEKQEFRFSYSRRINRPQTRQLNPFTDYSNPKRLRTGNPNLLPEYIDAFELNWNPRSMNPLLVLGGNAQTLVNIEAIKFHLNVNRLKINIA